MAPLAERIRRHFLWLLLATYLVAWLVPAPGVAIAQWQWEYGLPRGDAIRLPMVLVAVLLFNAALAVELRELRGVLRRAPSLAAALVGVWLGPALVVVAASLLFALVGGVNGAGLLLGMSLVAAMPVANSSAGWAQQSGGALGWALALVVLSIVLSPVVTPGVLRLVGMSLSAAEAARVEQLVLEFSGKTFIVWVLVPTALGMLARHWMGAERAAGLRPATLLTTSLAILALNYVNGSLALPGAVAEPRVAVIVSAFGAALAMCLSGIAGAGVVGRLFGMTPPARLALRFALSMKHTGLALALASAFLENDPEANLFIIIATPTQHVVAGIIARVNDQG